MANPPNTNEKAKTKLKRFFNLNNPKYVLGDLYTTSNLSLKYMYL